MTKQPYKRLTQDQVKRILQLAATHTAPQIAATVGTYRHQVHAVLRRHGMRAKPFFATPEQIEMITALKDTHTCTQIGRIVGFSKQRVRHIVHPAKKAKEEYFRW